MLNMNTILIAPRLVIQQYNKGITKYKEKFHFKSVFIVITLFQTPINIALKCGLLYPRQS